MVKLGCLVGLAVTRLIKRKGIFGVDSCSKPLNNFPCYKKAKKTGVYFFYILIVVNQLFFIVVSYVLCRWKLL